MGWEKAHSPVQNHYFSDIPLLPSKRAPKRAVRDKTQNLKKAH